MKIRLTKLDISDAAMENADVAVESTDITIESTDIKWITSYPYTYRGKETSMIMIWDDDGCDLVSETVAESPEEVIAAIKEAAKQRAIEIAQEYAESDDPEVYSVYMPPEEENGLI